MKFASMILMGAAVLSSCKKSEDPTPDANPNAKVFETKMYATNYGSTTDAIVVGTVSTADNTVKLRLNVNHSGSNNLNKIYITKTVDNGTAAPLEYIGSITNSAGTFAGSNSTYTLDVPSGTKSFVLDIPVSVRTSALPTATDVYSIWLTDGTGGFDKPTKNRVLGIATITLKYSATGTSTTFTNFTGTVGDQQAVEPSYIVTSGQGNVMTQIDYRDNTNGQNAKSVDISFASLDATGAALGTNPYLISPSIRTSVGFNPVNEPNAANTNLTYFAPWSGTAFASVTATDLSTISASATKVAISANSTYAFVTSAGKKGLIQVGTITTSGTNGKKFSFTVKVLN